jgi:hypothetical protein
MRFSSILRALGLTVVGLMLGVLLFVQFQQRLLRHRAERLHSEILALQLHPGTFADIQRLEREWGSHAHYEGSCTEHHCIYEIKLSDVFLKWTDGLSYDFDRKHRLFRLYSLLGGHPASVFANVRVRDNRMWGADFTVLVMTYPGKGRNEGQTYAVITAVDSGSRLLRRQEDFRTDLLQQGFRTDEELQCAGCEYVTINMTPLTNPKDIERFNQLNLDCIARWFACKHPQDMAPELWAQALLDKSRTAPPEEQACTISPSLLAREANDILLVKSLSLKTVQPPDGGEAGQIAAVRVLQSLKNGRAYRTTDTLEFGTPPNSIRPQDQEAHAQLVPGDEYFFLYRQPRPNEIEAGLYLSPCHGLLNTPENAAAIKVGIALDPSTGEAYDYRNDPSEESPQ